jgi:hypothetical protein
MENNTNFDLIYLCKNVPEFEGLCFKRLSILDFCSLRCVSKSYKSLIDSYASRSQNCAAKLAIAKTEHQEKEIPWDKSYNYLRASGNGSLLSIWFECQAVRESNADLFKAHGDTIMVEGHLFDFESQEELFVKIRKKHIPEEFFI